MRARLAQSFLESPQGTSAPDVAAARAGDDTINVPHTSTGATVDNRIESVPTAATVQGEILKSVEKEYRQDATPQRAPRQVLDTARSTPPSLDVTIGSPESSAVLQRLNDVLRSLENNQDLLKSMSKPGRPASSTDSTAVSFDNEAEFQHFHSHGASRKSQ